MNWPALLELAPLALLLRATAILLGALALHHLLLRGSSALSRHTMWATAMIGLLALPLLHIRLPRLAIPGWRASSPIDEATTSSLGEGDAVLLAWESAPRAGAPGAPQEVEPRTAPIPAPTSPPIDWVRFLTILWVTGSVAIMMSVMIAVYRARLLVREATPATATLLLVRLAHLRRLMRVRREVSVVHSARVRTPMAWGFGHPVILLPTGAVGWNADRLDAVLVHELVHIRRADSWHQLIARLVEAGYWFHPLAWRAARHAAVAREDACDDAVLQFGTRPSGYARHLVELAEDGAKRPLLPAFARFHHPTLEDRVMTILRHRPAHSSPWRGMAAVAALVTWTLAVAAVGPAAAQRPAPPPPKVRIPAPARPAPPAPVATPTEPTLAPLPPTDTVRVPVTLPRVTFPAEPRRAPPPPSLAARAPAIPAPPPPRLTCDRSGDTAPSRTAPVHVVSRRLSNGETACLAVHGDLGENFRFSPLGVLPVGATLILEATKGRGTQRMEIRGGTKGNQVTWLVNGKERAVDAAAREWQAAMLEVLALGSRISQSGASADSVFALVQRLEANASRDTIRLRTERILVDHRAARAQELALVQHQRGAEMQRLLIEQQLASRNRAAAIVRESQSVDTVLAEVTRLRRAQEMSENYRDLAEVRAHAAEVRLRSDTLRVVTDSIRQKVLVRLMDARRERQGVSVALRAIQEQRMSSERRLRAAIENIDP